MNTGKTSQLILASHSEQDTLAIAHCLAARLNPGLVMALYGDLGCGKTVFARGLIQALGNDSTLVTSPTFSFLNPYPEGRIPVYHFDLYRLRCAEDWITLGFEEYLDLSALTIVEWPEKAASLLPKEQLTIHFMLDDADEYYRRLILTAVGTLALDVINGPLDCLNQFLAPPGLILSSPEFS